MVEGFQTPFKASGTPGYDISPLAAYCATLPSSKLDCYKNNIVPVLLLVVMRLIIHAEYLKDNAFG
jgi:hypothetical protein